MKTSGSGEAQFSVHIETYGCQMNVYDTSAMHGLLASAGFRRAENCEQADVVLLNTCSVRDHAEQKIASRVGQLRQLREQGDRPRIVGISGCMAERLGQRLLEGGAGVDLVVGVDQYERLPELLKKLLSRERTADQVAVGHRPDVHYVAPAEAYPANNSHLVTIHKGCDYRCTYCVVPATRGPQREKEPRIILDEIRQILAGGGREVTLIGQNVTAYRWKEELDFAGLLWRVAELRGLRRIRFLTGHPRDMSASLLETMAAEPRICPSLHLPMQSGSDRILRRMKRMYRRQEYLDLIRQARRTVPDVTFSSDFIVGFPGETDSDFRATLEVIREVGYDQVFAFKYSERPDTPAARLEDDVPLEVKKQRLAGLLATQLDVWQVLAGEQIGQVWRVAVEGPARRPPDLWKARTANNRKVLLSEPDLQPGDELSVRVTSWQNTTFRGEPLDRAR